MDLNGFVANFAEQFDETDKSAITGNTEFKGLEEWSSMTALSVIAMIDSEYDIQIKGADIRDSATVAELFGRVQALASSGNAC